MIGNAYPFGNTGFSILEEGDLNPTTLSLDVSFYWAVDRQAKMLSKFSTKDEAERFLRNYIEAQHQASQQ